MKQIFNISMVVGLGMIFILSGCEMTVGIPQSHEMPKKVKPIIIQSVEGRTPLELLQASQKNVQTVYYPDWGYYIIQIGKIKNEIELGPEGRYWVLFLNGKQVKEGTDTVRLKGDEQVEFRFERSGS